MSRAAAAPAALTVRYPSISACCSGGSGAIRSFAMVERTAALTSETWSAMPASWRLDFPPKRTPRRARLAWWWR
eukprot:scaffold4716_cov109-Isochrysis_galbana.AAC.8